MTNTLRVSLGCLANILPDQDVRDKEMAVDVGKEDGPVKVKLLILFFIVELNFISVSCHSFGDTKRC